MVEVREMGDAHRVYAFKALKCRESLERHEIRLPYGEIRKRGFAVRGSGPSDEQSSASKSEGQAEERSQAVPTHLTLRLTPYRERKPLFGAGSCKVSHNRNRLYP